MLENSKSQKLLGLALFRYRYIVILLSFVLTSIILSSVLVTHVQNIVGNQTHLDKIHFIKIYSLFTLLLLLVYYYGEAKFLGLKNTLSSIISVNIFYLLVVAIFYINVSTGNHNLINTFSSIVILLGRVVTLLIFVRIDWRSKLLELWKYKLKYIFTLLVIYAASVMFLFSFHNPPHENGLIWETSDSVAYKNLSDTLVVLSPEQSYFWLGQSLLMTPFNLLMGTFLESDELFYDNYLNISLSIFFGFILTPIGLLLLVKSALINLNQYRFRIYILLTIVLVAIFTLYLAVLPNYEYLSISDTKRMWLRVLGFIAAVEPLINLGSCIFIFVLAYWDKVKFNPYIIGLVGGIFLLAKEPNFIMWGLFLMTIIWKSKELLWMFKAAFTSFAIYSIQLVYNIALYGDLFQAGRAEQDVKVGYKFIEYVQDAYGLVLENAPRISLSYFGPNFKNIIDFYALPLIVILAVSILLYRSPRFDKKLLLFCLSNIVFFLFFYAAYIRLGATTRYFSVLLPFVGYMMLLFVILCLEKLNLSRFKRLLSI